jgi:hypothetical protein
MVPAEYQIEIGDKLRRLSSPQAKYPGKWFSGATDDRSAEVSPIKVAIVELLSMAGYWAKASSGEFYHVSHMAIRDGHWVKV